MRRLAKILSFPARRVHEQLPIQVLVPADTKSLRARLDLLAELDPQHRPVPARPIEESP